MQLLEVSAAVRHIYIYVIRQLKVNNYFMLTLCLFRRQDAPWRSTAVSARNGTRTERPTPSYLHTDLRLFYTLTESKNNSR